jgi:deazaflavin-dependent oxidoreductase (nitroreductase family)
VTAEPTPPPTRIRFIKPFTTRVFNRFTRLFVHRLPGFAIISHRGRRSGKTYRTPMNVFRDRDSYVFALTYGSGVHWVQNVLASGEADLQVGSKTIHLTSPELFVDPSRQLMPRPVRILLGFLRVTEFLRMQPTEITRSSSRSTSSARSR